MTIFRFIAAKKTEHSIQIMCRVLEVSRSGYHAWATRPPSARAVADETLTGRIAVIHKQSGETYGSPRCTPSCGSVTAGGWVVSGSSG